MVSRVLVQGTEKMKMAKRRLFTSTDQVFRKHDRAKIFFTVPKTTSDVTTVHGAWGILLCHHKHYTREVYDSWNYDDSVELLNAAIESGEMEPSMENTLAKLKFQEEMLSKMKDPETADYENDEPLQGITEHRHPGGSGSRPKDLHG